MIAVHLLVLLFQEYPRLPSNLLQTLWWEEIQMWQWVKTSQKPSSVGSAEKFLNITWLCCHIFNYTNCPAFGLTVPTPKWKAVPTTHHGVELARQNSVRRRVLLSTSCHLPKQTVIQVLSGSELKTHPHWHFLQYRSVRLSRKVLVFTVFLLYFWWTLLIHLSGILIPVYVITEKINEWSVVVKVFLFNACKPSKGPQGYMLGTVHICSANIVFSLRSYQHFSWTLVFNTLSKA